MGRDLSIASLAVGYDDKFKENYDCEDILSRARQPRSLDQGALLESSKMAEPLHTCKNLNMKSINSQLAIFLCWLL